MKFITSPIHHSGCDRQKIFFIFKQQSSLYSIKNNHNITPTSGN